MAFPVLVDACVLIPMAKADLLLRLADARQFRILWSEEILEEVERNLVDSIKLRPEFARRRVSTMRDYFPDALIEDYSGLVSAMTNDPKDRHVLAAAVRANAELIVTDNVRDFPIGAVEPYEIEVRSTDDFLLDQLDLNPSTVIGVVHDLIIDLQNPRMTWDQYIDALYADAHLPLFAEQLRRTAGA